MLLCEFGNGLIAVIRRERRIQNREAQSQVAMHYSCSFFYF